MRRIVTSRLMLEPQIEAHAPEMFALLQDPALYRYENEAPQSVAWLRERFRRLESRASADGREHWLNWVVRHPASGLIGFVQATVHDDRSAGIAYVLASAYWGRVFAREAVAAMIRELSDSHEVRMLRAVLKRRNARSVHLLERLDFALAPGDAPPPEIEDDEILMLRDLGLAPAGPAVKGERHE